MLRHNFFEIVSNICICVDRLSGAEAMEIKCITFGAPLVGDLHLQHIVEERGWRDNILNVVTRHDLVPRVMVANLAGGLHIVLVALAFLMLSDLQV